MLTEVIKLLKATWPDEDFNPDEPRSGSLGHEGEWTSGGSGGTKPGEKAKSRKRAMTVYHGTVNTYLDSISKEGLTINSQRRNYGAKDFYTTGNRGEMIFVAKNMAKAEYYARDLAAKGTNRQAVVLEIRIPGGEAAKLSHDPWSGGEQFPNHIPPSWIRGVSKVSEAAAEDNVGYIGVVLQLKG